jgi:hypothetical protein
MRKKDTLFCGKPITPFDPNDIKQGKVDTIIIASYGFQETIAKIIENSDVECNVVKLF